MCCGRLAHVDAGDATIRLLDSCARLHAVCGRAGRGRGACHTVCVWRLIGDRMLRLGGRCAGACRL